MNASDWSDPENVRNLAVSQLADICMAMGLSWSANDKKFTIELPDVVLSRATASKPATKHFDQEAWGNIDVFGNKVATDSLPDDMQLPDYGQILDEGVPPQGDPNAEV